MFFVSVVFFISRHLALCSDEDSRIAGTEKQRGAKKSDILTAMQDIRKAMIACGNSTNKYVLVQFEHIVF